MVTERGAAEEGERGEEVVAEVEENLHSSDTS